MNSRWIRLGVVVVSVGVVGSVGMACELAVQLDRSFVDAGEDAGCPICSDVAEEVDDEGGGDARTQSTEAGAEASARDGGAETSTPDSGAGE